MLRPILAVLATLLAASAAHAQGYPSRPVKIIVPFAAGGPAEEFGKFLQGDIEKWARIVKISGAGRDR